MRFDLDAVASKHAVVGRPSSDTRELEESGSRATLRRCDVTCPESLPASTEGSWAVVQLAGHRHFWNRCQPEHVPLKAAQASTPLAFDVPDRIPFDEESGGAPHPSDYERGKYEDDVADWRSDEDQGLPITIVYIPKLEGARTTYIHVHLRDDT